MSIKERLAEVGIVAPRRLDDMSAESTHFYDEVPINRDYIPPLRNNTLYHRASECFNMRIPDKTDTNDPELDLFLKKMRRPLDVNEQNIEEVLEIHQKQKAKAFSNEFSCYSKRSRPTAYRSHEAQEQQYAEYVAYKSSKRH